MLRLLNTLFVFIVATIFYWLGLLMFSPLGIGILYGRFNPFPVLPDITKPLILLLFRFSI